VRSGGGAEEAEVIPDYHILKAQQRDLYRLSQVYVNLKVDILATALVRLRVSADGSLMDVGYDPETEARLAEVDALWTDARRMYKEQKQ
jgi:hypothetical protein